MNKSAEQLRQAAKDCAFNMYDVVDGEEIPWAKNKYEGDIGVKFYEQGHHSRDSEVKKLVEVLEELAKVAMVEIKDKDIFAKAKEALKNYQQ